MSAMTDIRPFDRRALEVTEAIVDQVKPDQLGLPTPCAQWSLRQLLAHMAGQNHGFAAAADGEVSDDSVWADRPVDDDPAGVFRASSRRVTAAFAREGVLDGEFWLPQVRGGQMFPARTAIGFHFVDYVVHGWDVAATLSIPAPFDEETLTAVLPYAEEVPDGPNRRAPDASFRPALPVRDGGPLLDRVLALLGRSPKWPA
nr:TIGR03086 family metal-binding protein [Streptomyces sp. Xyl84]